MAPCAIGTRRNPAKHNQCWQQGKELETEEDCRPAKDSGEEPSLADCEVERGSGRHCGKAFRLAPAECQGPQTHG